MYDNQLDTLIKVADCGSFNKAAEMLFVSPTAIMKQINSLENRIGLQLLKRNNHGVSLTEAGESIYKDAKFIINYSEKSIQRAHQIVNTEQYTIRVGTSILNPCKILMDLWAQVNDIHPHFKIKIVPFEDDHNNILSTIDKLGEQFSFIVGACESSQWLSRCNFYELGQYNICCAIPRKHGLAEKKKLSISDLYGERLVMVARGDSDTIDEIRDSIEKEHTQIQIEDTPYFYDIDVFNTCEQTGNILLTLDSWKEIHPSLVTIPMDWNYTIPYGLIYPINPLKDILEFLDAVKANLK